MQQSISNASYAPVGRFRPVVRARGTARARCRGGSGRDHALRAGVGSRAAQRSRTAAPAWTQSGRVSWYGPGFHGRRTASGEIFDSNDLTMAHRSLPLGSRVRVTNLDNGRSVVLRVNDRGPYVSGRIADLSRAAAGRLDFIDDGVVRRESNCSDRRTGARSGRVGHDHVRQSDRRCLRLEPCEFAVLDGLSSASTAESAARFSSSCPALALGRREVRALDVAVEIRELRVELRAALASRPARRTRPWPRDCASGARSRRSASPAPRRWPAGPCRSVLRRALCDVGGLRADRAHRSRCPCSRRSSAAPVRSANS